MNDEFNFKMKTKYKLEFKNEVTYAALYRILAEERVKNEYLKKQDLKDYEVQSLVDSFIEKFKTMISKNNSSSVKSRLRDQLRFDINAYAEQSDEEKFNVMKLLYFIVNTIEYETQDGKSKKKTLSVIDLLLSPSLDHTDAENAKYEKHFRNIIEGIHPGVTHADDRDDAFERIHTFWRQIQHIINLTVMEDVHPRRMSSPESYPIWKKFLMQFSGVKWVRIRRLWKE